MAGKIQNEDIKTSAELISAGGTASQLPNDTKVYVTASSINKTLNQAIIDGDIGGGAGGINYIPLSQSNGASASGWATYANAAGTAPVNGTGGSPSSTFATSANTSLVGANNYLWTKSAANRQGEGFSYDFSIDPAYQAKPMSVSFLYSIASGTFASGDMSVWIYDVTNAVLIQPSASQILNGSGAIVQKCEFQSSSNSTSYRLIVHTSSVSALAYSLRFDSFSVSPNTYSTGASITEPVAYTPTFSNFGTVTGINFTSWRSGANLNVSGTFTVGTLVAAEARISLGFNGVNGVVTSKSTLPTLSIVGYGAGNSANQPMIPLIEASKTYMTLGIENSSNNVLTKRDGNFWNNGSTYSINAVIPIEGWGTSQVLSSETDTRIVAAIIRGQPQTSYTLNTPIVWPTVFRDSHSAYNASTGEYTAPVSGNYQITFAANTNLVANNYVNAYVDGVSQEPALMASSPSSGQISGAGMVFANGGQKITVRASGSWSAVGSLPTGLTIARVSGPAQIAASEKIIAKYGVSANRSTDSSTPINMDTKIIDTHGAVTTGSGWKFTAPRSGTYRVSAALEMTASTGLLSVYKNGVDNSFMGQFGAAVGGGGTTILQLIAGDYIDFRVNTGSTKTVVGTAGYNVCIESI